MERGKSQMTEGIELPNQERIKCRKTKSILKCWKIKKSIPDKQENFLKPNSAVEISSSI